AEDGIRDRNVTGVQTCALPIFRLFTYLAEVRYRELPLPLLLVGRYQPRFANGRIHGAGDKAGIPGCREIHTCIQIIKTLLVDGRSEEHTSELQSRFDLVCRLLL